MCSASLTVTSRMSFTLRWTCGKPVMQRIHLKRKKERAFVCMLTSLPCERDNEYSSVAGRNSDVTDMSHAALLQMHKPLFAQHQHSHCMKYSFAPLWINLALYHGFRRTVLHLQYVLSCTCQVEGAVVMPETTVYFKGQRRTNSACVCGDREWCFKLKYALLLSLTKCFMYQNPRP